MDEQDRRVFKRIPARLELFVGSIGKEKERSPLKNMSAEGLSFSSYNQYSVGEHVEIEMRVEHEPPLLLKGVVQWSKEVIVQGKIVFTTGVILVELTGEDEYRYIRRYAREMISQLRDV